MSDDMKRRLDSLTEKHGRTHSKKVTARLEAERDELQGKLAGIQSLIGAMRKGR